MTPLPKRRHSTRRGGKRKAAIKLTLVRFSTCANCGKTKLPHRVCKHCGYYKGKSIRQQDGKKNKHIFKK